MKIGEKRVKNLNKEISIIEIKEFTNNVSDTLKKESFKEFIETIINSTPFIFGLGISLFCKNIIYILIGIGGSVASLSIFKAIDYYKNKTNKKNKTLKQIYYTDDYKEFLGKDFINEEDVRLEYERYVNAYKSKLIEDSEIMFLTKGEAISQINAELEVYYQNYKLPRLIVSNKAWEKYFDIIYEFFISKECDDLFYDKMSSIVRFTLANAYLNPDETITIENFINALTFLECENMSDEEIYYLMQNISHAIKHDNKHIKKLENKK